MTSRKKKEKYICIHTFIIFTMYYLVILSPVPAACSNNSEASAPDESERQSVSLVPPLQFLQYARLAQHTKKRQ